MIRYLVPAAGLAICLAISVMGEPAFGRSHLRLKRLAPSRLRRCPSSHCAPVLHRVDGFDVPAWRGDGTSAADGRGPRDDYVEVIPAPPPPEFLREGPRLEAPRRERGPRER